MLIAAIGLPCSLRRLVRRSLLKSVYEEPVIARPTNRARLSMAIVAPQLARTGPRNGGRAGCRRHDGRGAPDPDAVSVTDSDSAEMETLARVRKRGQPAVDRAVDETDPRRRQSGRRHRPFRAVGNWSGTPRCAISRKRRGSPRESRGGWIAAAAGDHPNVDIDAGRRRQVEAEIMLPTAGLSDTVLPVVVADAHIDCPTARAGRPLPSPSDCPTTMS
jgi:hypothetical protein